MSFYNTCLTYQDYDFDKFFKNLSLNQIVSCSSQEEITAEQFLILLSPKIDNFLEEFACRAHDITIRHFGRTIQLYTPMYLSNFCDNSCLYCGFNKNNKFLRKKLDLDKVREEAKIIAAKGFKHILILTGESKSISPVSYIKDCVDILNEYFSSIAIETYALDDSEYELLINAGVSGLTIYQEVYDQKIYDTVHPEGPKKDYQFRLDAPERAARKKIRAINLGVLLGLADWRKEVFLLGLHAKYLHDNYGDVEISVSLPRLRPHQGEFIPQFQVSDKDLVQIMVALRLFLPYAGITLSTREEAGFRDNLLPLGVTRMSAESSTVVGGHSISSEALELPQFEISDQRNLEEVKRAIIGKGYQPVLKDWLQF